MKNYIITIARGFGSGGRELASALADDLGIHSYEHRILSMASKMSGRPEEDFLETDERLRGNNFSRAIQKLQKRLSPVPELQAFASDDRVYEYEAEIIRNLANEENCIIVGKCADYVLRDYANVLSVYVEAPREFCQQMVMDRLNTSREAANDMIEKTDKYRADYYRYYTKGNDWRNPVNYDIILNSGRLGLDGCRVAVKQMMLIKFGDLLDQDLKEKLYIR